MTDDSDFSDRHDGDYDPKIADRFRVLERVTPPDIDRRTVVMAAPGSSNEPNASGPRSGFLLAVAACVGVLMVGIVTLVAINGGSGDRPETDLIEEAGDGGENPVVADGASDTTAALIVEGDDGVRSSTRSETDEASSESVDGTTDGDASTANNSNGDGSNGDGSTGNAAGGGNGSGSDGDDAADSDPPTSARGSISDGSDGPSVTVGDSPGVMPAADGDRPVSTFSTATTDVLPTTAGGSGDAAATVFLRGTVTEVFTDCVSRLVLTETGQVVQGGPVSCDGGSYIVVGGTRVFTSSGFTSADLAFDKHPSNLKPGQEVSVTATRTGGPAGPLTLACDGCRVRLI
ncbi:MAG: hypothetical protein OES24_20820 [Acidimicrobiia bacterium]|nr:hypothetical protein [Acidimicrobiia bacterium]